MKATALLVLLCLAPSLEAAQDIFWPAWRGPTGNGHAADSANPPIQWSENENVKWKVELPGLGNSTPCVVDNKIILSYTKPTGRKIEVTEKDSSGNLKPNEFHKLFVIAYDLKNGEEIWKTEVAEAVPNSVCHPTGSYAAASMVTDGKQVYAFFGSLGMFALDLDGKVAWNYQLPKMKTLANFGEGASPVVQDDVLVIPWDEQGQSFVAGIDTASGKEKWRTDRVEDSSWTTPLLIKDGDRSLVVLSATERTRAYDLQSGSEIWNCGGMSSNPTSSPVADGNVVFVGNSYRGNVLQAINFEGAAGDLSQSSNLLWTHQKAASYVPTPVVLNNKIYFLKDSVGILNCLDAKTGRPAFSPKRIGLKKIHASPMVAAKRIYLVSLEGDAVVLDPEQEGKTIAKNHLDDTFGASPVAVGSSLILRGAKHLYCIEQTQ
jgi:outer membrane protein assembly factor BamB